MVGIRFGETVKSYVAKYGDASRLTAIPLGIAGWLRYLLGAVSYTHLRSISSASAAVLSYPI